MRVAPGLRPALAGTAVAILMFAGAGCSGRMAEEPGAVGGVIDAPLALISATADDLATTELYLASANGAAAPKLVPTFVGPKWEVRWSVDGKRLAITGSTGGVGTGQVPLTSDIWTINADGTGLARITTDGRSDAPSWLPDGRLVFTRTPPGGASQYFAVPAAGGAPAPLTLRGGQALANPDWSRTAGLLAFNGGATIYTAATDGSGEAALASGALPRWSPSGNRIAYFGSSNGAPTLFVVTTDGRRTATRVAGLSDFAEFGGFTWAQDGRRVAWVRTNAAGIPEAVSAPIDGSAAPTVLVPRGATTVAYDVDLDWRPTALP